MSSCCARRTVFAMSAAVEEAVALIHEVAASHENIDAVALLKGTASWLPEDDAKMRAWCQKYGEWLRHTPERLTDNSHRWWWGGQ